MSDQKAVHGTTYRPQDIYQAQETEDEVLQIQMQGVWILAPDKDKTMKFQIELKCQHCCYYELLEQELEQDFVPMSMKTHQCYSHIENEKGVMLPHRIITKE